MNIGMNLPFLTWGLAVGYENVFSIKALDNEGPIDLTGWEVSLVVETVPETVFPAEITTSLASWIIPAEDATSDLVGRAVRLDVSKDGKSYLWARGRVQNG